MNNPNFGKPLTEAWIALAKLEKPVLSDSMKSKMSADRGTAIKVLDLKTQETSVHTSIKKAAGVIGVSHPAISKRLSQNKDSFIVVKKRYQVEKVNAPGTCPSREFSTMPIISSKPAGGSFTLSDIRDYQPVRVYLNSDKEKASIVGTDRYLQVSPYKIR